MFVFLCFDVVCGGIMLMFCWWIGVFIIWIDSGVGWWYGYDCMLVSLLVYLLVVLC